MKFFVFKHTYDSENSWWEHWHNRHSLSPEPIEAESLEALIDSLHYDGLYSIFTLAEGTEHVEVQVTTETVHNRQVIKR